MATLLDSPDAVFEKAMQHDYELAHSIVKAAAKLPSKSPEFMRLLQHLWTQCMTHSEGLGANAHHGRAVIAIAKRMGQPFEEFAKDLWQTSEVCTTLPHSWSQPTLLSRMSC
jgi:hypothetical protein